MTQDEIIRMAREAGIKESDVVVFGHFPFEFYQLERFAALVAAHEREKWEPAFSKNKPAPKIENGNVYFEAGLYTPLEVQLAIDLLTEREACAKVCAEGASAYVNSDYTKGLVHGARLCAAAIRARGNNK